MPERKEETQYARGVSDGRFHLEQFGALDALTIPEYELRNGAMGGSREYVAGMVALLVGVSLLPSRKAEA